MFSARTSSEKYTVEKLKSDADRIMMVDVYVTTSEKSILEEFILHIAGIQEKPTSCTLTDSIEKLALIKFELDPKFLPDVLALNKRFPDLAIQDVTKKEQMAEKETTKTKPSFAIQINIAAIRDHLFTAVAKKS